MAKKKSRRGLTGIIALVLLITIGIAVTAYLVSQQQDPRSRASENFRDIRRGTNQLPGQECAQVLTPARNTQDNTCRTFPSSCLPSGWEKDPSCTEQAPQTTNDLCDVDNNGTTSLTDYALITQCIQGGQLCSDEVRTRADLNSDGSVDAVDLNTYHRTCQPQRGGSRQP